MAVDLFIEPALRRWRSYDRRLRRHTDKSLEHRAQDLESGLLDWYTEHYGLGYDPGCIHHLAHSFAEILFHGTKTIPEVVKVTSSTVSPAYSAWPQLIETATTPGADRA